MASVVVVLIVVALIGGVIWNHGHRSAAFAGVESVWAVRSRSES